MTQSPENINTGQDTAPGTASEVGKPIVEVICGGLAAGFIFGMHWPGAFLSAFILGAFFSHRVSRSRVPTSLFWSAYILSCILFHYFAATYSYAFIYSVNPRYLISAGAVSAIAFFACVSGRPAMGLLIGFIFISVEISIAKYNQPMFFFGFVVLLIADRYSGRLKTVPASLIALAVFNSILAVGVLSIGGSHEFPIYHKVLIENDGPQTQADAAMLKRFFKIDKTVVEAIGKQREAIGRGRLAEVVAGPGGDEITVLMKRRVKSYIAILDRETLAYKRKSFQGAVGDTLAISGDGRFLASVTGGTLALLDEEILGWRATLELGIKGPVGVEFGPPGMLYVSSAVSGMLYLIEYDGQGRKMKVAKTRHAGPGILGLEYISDRGIVAAGNYIDGMFYFFNGKTLDMEASVFIGPYVRMDRFIENDGKIFFVLNRGRYGTGFVYLDEISRRGIEAQQPVSHMLSFFVLSAKLLRSTL